MSTAKNCVWWWAGTLCEKFLGRGHKFFLWEGVPFANFEGVAFKPRTYV